jgi:hypothetical protein
MIDRDGAMILQGGRFVTSILTIPEKERIMNSKCKRPVDFRNRKLLQLHDIAIEPREDTALGICGSATRVPSLIVMITFP